MNTMKRVVRRRTLLRRALLVGLPTALVSGISLHFRIPQLVTFVLASVTRRAWMGAKDAQPGPQAHAWSLLTPPALPARPSASRAVVTYHPWYQGFQPALVNQCLAELRAVGASYVRSDVRWSDVMPDAVHPDEAAFAWYRAYFEAARDWYGLRPLIVLSNPPNALQDLAAQAQMDAWRQYVEQVALRLGDLCDVYQPLNEPNNPTYAIFEGASVAASIRIAAQILRERNLQTTIVVNIIVDLWNWKDTLDELLRSAGDAIDVIGLDHYPSTWTTSSASDWGVVTEAAAMTHARDLSPSVNGKPIAILETGYATNVGWLRSDERQAAYFRTFRNALASLEQGDSPLRMTYVGLYELNDAASGAFLDPEAHFGLLTSALKRKPAFYEAQAIFATL